MANDSTFVLSLASVKEQEVDVVSIDPAGSPLYTMFTMPGRDVTAEGTYSQMGLGELTWSNGHKWFAKEVDENTNLFTVDGAVLAAATSIVLDSVDGMIVSAILNVPSTGEQLLVTAIDAGTKTITVTRAYGTTAAANIADDAVLYFVSTSVASGQSSVDVVSVEAKEVDNEIQKIVTTVRQSDAEDFINLYPNLKDPVGGFMAHSIREHNKRIERAVLLSQKKYNPSTKSGTMEGIYELAKRSGNYADLSSTLTKATLISALRKPFLYGNPSKKYAVCGSNALDKIGLLFDSNFVLNDSIENTSLKFGKLILTGGEELRFVRHPFMNASTGLDSYAIVVDPSCIRVVYATGKAVTGASVSGKTRIIPNLANSTYADTIIDIVTYMTLANTNAKAHGLVKLA